MSYNRFEKICSLVLLLFAIGFNLWLYRLEPTAKIDPNDNTFQYALVDRTNQIWDFAIKTCPKNLSFVICHLSFLVDHWVPNWAQGYNLPFYYSHIPQIFIVGSFRFLSFIGLLDNLKIGLFEYYHWIIYLLLSFFPLSVFLGLRILRLPWIAAGIGALLASHLSTDGLYGLDPPSFLWRGYGLSSQLFAMIFLPLAIAYSLKYLSSSPSTAKNEFFKKRSFWLAVLFIFLTTQGHLGIGIIVLMSVGVIAFAPVLISLFAKNSANETFTLVKQQMLRLIFLGSVSLFFLSYWVIPTVLGNNYHNISVWDPIWKFDSYGAKNVITNLLNGDLFDFGRLPILNLLTLVGFFSVLTKYYEPSIINSFSFLFLFWLLLYFGRTTWGGLIDLVPGMKEFHISRFLVGLHLAGLFLAPLGLVWLVEKVVEAVRIIRLNYPFIRMLAYWSIGLLIIIPVYRQTINYNGLNDKLIRRANLNFDKVKPDTDALFATLRSLPPGRVFAGRGGGWGKNFRIAETPYYMHLSTYGLPTILWLPETWSNNSDTEQFFSEDVASHYRLYNVRYIVTPPTQAPQAFWRLIKETASWKLYEVISFYNSEGNIFFRQPEIRPKKNSSIESETGGELHLASLVRAAEKNVSAANYFTSGLLPAAISGDKQNFINLIHQWIQSDYHQKNLYPRIVFTPSSEKLSRHLPTDLPRFQMLDEANYQLPDKSIHNLFAEPPLYLPPKKFDQAQLEGIIITNEDNDSDMIFRAKINLQQNCSSCLVILRQTFHPNWQATVNGKIMTTINVFPSFVAIPFTQAGQYEVNFSYQPSRLKVALLTVEITVLAIFIIFALRQRFL